MKKISDPELFKTIKSFLTVYLPKIKSRSPHTIQAYKDTLNNFARFMDCSKNIPLHKLETEHFNSDNIMDFLNWLQSSKKNSDTTRNHRLMSIRTFCRYLVRENIADYGTYAQIKDIDKIPVPDRFISDILSVDDVKLVLELPNISKNTGLRDRFYMALLYDTGCRNQEILDLKIGDVKLNKDSGYVNILGKGSKPRTTPISKEIVPMYEQYVSVFHPNRNPQSVLFYTKRKGIVTPMSPDNTARFLKTYEALAKLKHPDMPHLHPHLFRHTRAMHMYQAGMPLPLVSQWLGHSQMETTLIYASADVEMKRAAFEKVCKPDDLVFSDEVFKFQNDDDAIKKLYGLA